jgi:CheY-specific phosphatase CheX
VSVPFKLARVVGAGFLGSEEMEVSDSQAEEVVCELANMICGSVLSRLESQETFRITHPELVPPERGAGFDGAGISRWFDLGDGILTVLLELQRTI